MNTSDTVTILMVDDQPAKLLSYEAILAGLGVDLIKATSPREALDHLLKNDIAVVLMDVSMPEMDGFELAAMMRQHPRYQKTAIIFVSAVHLTDLDRLKGYEVGAVDYLPVPVIPEILRAKVSVFADLHRKTRQLQRLNSELERRVEERTADLLAALQVRDEFLSIAAHELKTPVTGLRAMAQIVARKLERVEFTSPPWLLDGIRSIDQQAERLSLLISRLFDVSRIDQGKLSTERMATNLSELVEKLSKTFQARTKKHSITLAADADVVADVDPIAIEQVLSNLLDNAIKYSPQGGQIEVEVKCSNGGQARISVRDWGIGISPEKREAIFKRFYQAHAEDHRSGLGLGLYIARQIIDLHDGSIDVSFPSDGGTCFTVMLPMHATVPVTLTEAF